MAEIAIPVLGLGAMYILSNQNKEEEHAFSGEIHKSIWTRKQEDCKWEM